MPEPLRDLQVKLLRPGLKELGLVLPAATEQRLLDYVALLDKWNKTYNLTAVRDPVQMITHHILDSLAVRPFLQGPNTLDIGTGAGLPGIPLALACPQYQFTLLDSNAKKTRFVLQAKAELGLDNVQVVHERAERYRPAQKFATLLTRAFASLAEMLRLAGHLLTEDGEFLAMKGSYPKDELEQVSPPFRVLEVCRLVVPGLDEQRHLVRIGKI